MMFKEPWNQTVYHGLFQTGLLKEFYVLQVKIKLRLNFFHLV